MLRSIFLTTCALAGLSAGEADAPPIADSATRPAAGPEKPDPPPLEVFALDDQRVFTGSYDQAQHRLDVPGPVPFSITIDDEKISSRRPATAEETAAVQPRIAEPLTPEQQEARRLYWQKRLAQDAKDKAERTAREAKLRAEQAENERKRQDELAQRRAEAQTRAAAAAAAAPVAPPPSSGGGGGGGGGGY